MTSVPDDKPVAQPLLRQKDADLGEAWYRHGRIDQHQDARTDDYANSEIFS